MKTQAELIFVIPGLAFPETPPRLPLWKGLSEGSENPILEATALLNGGAGGTRLVGEGDDGPLTLDVVEASYIDLVPRLSLAPVPIKAMRGLSLFAFWLNAPVWRGFGQRKLLTAGLAFSSLVLIIWYLSVLVLLVGVFNQELSSLLGNDINTTLPDFVRWPAFGLTLLAGVVRVGSFVDISDIAKRFVLLEANNRSRSALKSEVRSRVRHQLRAALERTDVEYTTLTVIASSFGTLVAIDLLADLPPTKRSMHLVTLGSTAELLGRIDRRLVEEQTRLAEHPDLVSWIDVLAEGDWFASGAALPDESAGTATLTQKVVASPGTLFDRLTGKTHESYFANSDVASIILGGRRQS